MKKGEGESEEGGKGKKRKGEEKQTLGQLLSLPIC